jgi:hypothetical protein
MRYLGEAGFPVPEVYAAEGPDLVLSLVAGPTLAEAALAGAVTPGQVGEVLADLHSALDTIDPPDWLRASSASGGGSGQALVHHDLHPENVLVGRDGPVLIDWTNSGLGLRGVDRALTGLILGQVALTGPPELASAASLVLQRYLAVAGRPVASDRDLALARRRADPAVAADELPMLDEAARMLG